jgi:hypothetical protein
MPKPAALASLSTHFLVTYSSRSSSSPDRPLNVMKTCATNGMESAASCPRQSGFTGTSRQPNTVPPSPTIVRSTSALEVSRRSSSRGRNNIARP